MSANDQDKGWVYRYNDGEIWTDDNGNVWRKIGRTSRAQVIERQAAVPVICPKCDKGINRFDHFYLTAYNHCFICETKEELIRNTQK